MKVKILDILYNNTDDCNAMYFVKRNKVFYNYFVISIIFYFLLTLTSHKPDWNTLIIKKGNSMHIDRAHNYLYTYQFIDSS